MRLDGKTVLITDASTPLGKACAAVFTDEGAEVVTPERALYRADIDKAVTDTLNKYGRIDVLVYSHDELIKASVEHCTDEQFERVILVNAKAAFLYTRSVGRAMKETRGGCIVYLNSIHAEKPTGCAFAYSAAKSAVKMLCKEAALELGLYNVRVNAIETGGLEGDEERFQGAESPFYVDMVKKIPGGAAGSAESVAKIAAFLASGDSALLNGADIRADGAFTLKYSPRFTYEELEEYLTVSPIKPFNYNLMRSAALEGPAMDAEDGPMSLRNKAAVVTGGATGVGQGIAVALAKRGAKIAITAHRRPADETLRMIRDAGGEAICVAADLSSRSDAERLFKETYDAFGRIDILVNNAAVQINKWLLEAAEDGFDHVMNTNLGGYWRCTQAVIPYMRQSGNGRIINISSIHAKRPTDFDTVYSMSKAGIKMLTRESAVELAKYGIMVNMISLGAVRIQQKSGNPIWKPHPRWNPVNQPRGGFLSGRVGLPDDAGWIAAFLADDRSRFITGASIRADGGAMMV